jgi:hypothetical protein
MSFTKKRVDVTIALGTGQFGETGSNTVTLTGYRVQTMIQCAGGDAMDASQIRIFGLPLSMINQLTSVGPINAQIRNNTMQVAAGDDESGMQVVYSGTISYAWGEFQAAPDVALNITGFAGLIDAVKPVNALSYIGSTDVATIMQTLANTMGLAFENNGVQVQLSNPYFPGTALQQVRMCARAAGINWAHDRGTLAIWPSAGARASGDAPIISPANGMIGYPTFSSNGLNLATLFNPAIKIGVPIKVESSIPVACGVWTVTALTHTLESELPGGAWMSKLECVPGVITS